MRDTHIPAAALCSTLRAFGVALNERTLYALRGRSKREVIASAITDSTAHTMFQRLLLKEFERTAAEPVPGARAAVAQLRGAGIKVALNTGFDGVTTRAALASMIWPADEFDAMVVDGDVPAGRPAPFMIFRAMQILDIQDVRAVAVVGDTTADLHAGHHAGAGWVIGVTSGAHKRSTLVASPHSHLLDSIAQLPSLWL